MSVELKEIKDQIQQTYESLKKAADAHAEEVKKQGTATEETKSAVVKINTELDDLKKRLDAAETKMNRSNFGGGGEEEETAERKAFRQYVMHGKEGMSAEERKSLVADAQGQILIPEEVEKEIIRELPKLAIIRGLATVRPVTSDRLRRRSLSEVTVGWGKLEVSQDKKLGDFESSLVPGEEYQYVEDCYGLTKVGEDELDDTDVNLDQYISLSFTDAFAAAEDTAFIKGTGHNNNQPEGMLTGNTLERLMTAAAAMDADDLLKLQYEIPAQYRKNGVYIVNSAIELLMRLAKDENGQYLWQPSLQAGTPNSFAGKLMYNQDDVDGDVVAGKDVAIFGDIKSGYRILDRKGASITRLNELFIEEDLIGFRFKRRVTGGVIRPKAIKVLRIGG